MEAAIMSIFFGNITLIVFIVIFFRTRHRERLALIKYDKEAKIFRKYDKAGRGTLKIGLVALASGAGIIVGSVLDRLFGHRGPDVFTFACLLIFGGLALVYYYKYVNDIAPEKTERFTINDEDEMV